MHRIVKTLYKSLHIGFYITIVVAANLYGDEIWIMQQNDKNRKQVSEVRYLKHVNGARLLEIQRTEEIRRAHGLITLEE
jgi:hypothetical protein